MIKRMLFGFTLGMVAGAATYKKLKKSKLPEKVLKDAQEKLSED